MQRTLAFMQSQPEFEKTCKIIRVLGIDSGQPALPRSLIRVFDVGMKKWATTWQNQQTDVCPAKTQICLGIRPVWSESLLSAWRKLEAWVLSYPLSTQQRLDQTGRMRRLFWVFAGAQSFCCWFCVEVAQILDWSDCVAVQADLS